MEELPAALGSISEFAIGLAGFTGVLFVLSQPSGQDSSVAVLRFANLVVSSFAAGFFALLPMILASFAMPTADAINVAMGCLAMFMTIWLLAAAILMPRKGIVVWIAALMFGGAILVLGLQLAGLILFAASRPGLYTLGLYILLMQGAIVFSYAAVNVIRNRGEPAD